MAFMPILFYIVFFAIIINAKKQEKNGNQQKKREYTTSGVGNVSAIGEKKVTAQGIGTSEKKQVPVPNVSKKQTAVPNIPRKKEKKRKVLELHKEETLQPKIRTNNLWGEDKYAHSRIVALRLMEGDPVPQGYVVVRCPYCAAENLVTKNCKQHHSCYFCRVPID